MKDSLYLAWQYVRYHWGKTLSLVLAIGMVVFIPLALRYFTSQGADRMRARASATPLILGNKGSTTELMLSSLYFNSPTVPPIPYREVDSLLATRLTKAIPVHVEYKVKEQPLVGTLPSYFTFRQLSIREGRYFAVLGECVLGAQAAKTLNVAVGDTVISAPSGAFDVAGSFPLKMTVTGILNTSNSPDDQAVFTDLKTAWVISGKAHGHDQLNTLTADSLLTERTDSLVIANMAVLSYTEITPENIDSFHFHGDPGNFPVNAVLVVPNDKKSALLLRGRYESGRSGVQIVDPKNVMEELLSTVVTVEELVTAAALTVGLATLGIATLVFALSIQMRRREIHTLKQIGAATARVRGVLALEISLVIVSGFLLAGTLLSLTRVYGITLLEELIK